ncbi:WecB/TagA/CpsF family glycosyltransferase [Aurantiacibacter sp. MUD11]|uniref:WecB/TagA/CpsF family glycosyltransferase n=1 Tax=Aurantiacibacter sp. MUD11 TaxID=3003265 RepID=UPI0022AAED41|nr:WecB/TagA/CpsF family glycosyltransferase [Aurantiacibacter sp. MUD11]WAT17565.1 WecB/TagA/CpsF family glycosyltransferase [Aurantiacibacter sp. MUD11]
MTTTFPTERILDYQVCTLASAALSPHVARWLDAEDGKARHIACANPHSIEVARGDAAFKYALRQADLLVPDGVGIVFASKFLGGDITDRVTGFDIFQLASELLQARKGRMMFLGSSEEVLAIIREKMAQDYPGITVETYSPPYKPAFSDEDNAAMHAAVNAFKPDVLWVGMTAPKQEKWVEANRGKLDTKVIGSIGAVFDFYAGRIKRPAKVWRDLGLEWLPRLVGEPRRLWRRMFVSAPAFVAAVVADRVRRK